MKTKTWIVGWLTIVVMITSTIGYVTYKVDPFMHYRKPDTNSYYYVLDSERNQNDGITKFFDYDALITGTSMTENFKTSEMNSVFDCTSIKVPFAGGSNKEINENLKVALKYNSNLKIIIRGLDPYSFFFYKDYMISEPSGFPTYLYDDNPFNDVQYLFNRDVFWGRAYSMITTKYYDDTMPGITSFDDYMYWQQLYTFGVNAVLPEGFSELKIGEPIYLSDEERTMIYESFEQNVTSLANEYPNVDFYYFFAPFSVAWWGKLAESGEIYRQVEAEQYIIELILQTDNIKLFSFNNRYDITSDLNNYKDPIHYGAWINSLMLKWMQEGQYQLTKENYKEYLAKELEYYTSFDYKSIEKQEDYENDYYAAALYNEELTGIEPTNILLDETNVKLNSAELVRNQHDGNIGIQCNGSLMRSVDDEYSVEDSLKNNNYIGASLTIDIDADNKYIVFYGRKVEDCGQPTVMIFDQNNNLLKEFSVNFQDIDNEWHQYLIDVSDLSGEMKVVFNGGYIDNTGSAKSAYIFSDVYLY